MSANAQKVYFTDTTNRWYFLEDPGWKNVESGGSYSGDSLFNGYTYFRLEGGPGWVREDTANGIVYQKILLDSPEHILYNYNLSVGDTFISYDHAWDGGCDTFILGAIDTINIAGYTHKLQNFYDYHDTDRHAPYHIVIEGIGNMEARFSLAPLYHPDNLGLLTCFENNHRTVRIRPAIGFFDNMSSCQMLSVHNTIAKHVAAIIPNPANSSSMLRLSTTLQHATLTIFSSIGWPVAKVQIRQQSEIAIGHLLSTPGIYIYLLADDKNNITSTGRFIFQ